MREIRPSGLLRGGSWPTHLGELLPTLPPLARPPEIAPYLKSQYVTPSARSCFVKPVNASMGPRLLGRGEDAEFLPSAVHHLASMEPRLLGRGELEEKIKAFFDMLLQWSRAC